MSRAAKILLDWTLYEMQQTFVSNVAEFGKRFHCCVQAIMSNDWRKPEGFLAIQFFLIIALVTNAFLRELAKMITKSGEGFIVQVGSHYEKNAKCNNE